MGKKAGAKGKKETDPVELASLEKLRHAEVEVLALQQQLDVKVGCQGRCSLTLLRRSTPPDLTPPRPAPPRMLSTLEHQIRCSASQQLSDCATLLSNGNLRHYVKEHETVFARRAERDWRSKLDAYGNQMTQQREDTLDITADMSRQYKTMQDRLLTQIESLVGRCGLTPG